MAVADTRFAVGIPIGNPNFEHPNASGAPKGWRIGSSVSGHTFGVGRHPASAGTASAAHRYGTGRSLVIELQSDMTGVDDTDGIESPLTPAGVAPKAGTSVTVCGAAMMRADQAIGTATIRLIFRQYNAAAAKVADQTILTVSTGLSTTWTLFEDVATFATHADLNMCSLFISIDTNADTGDEIYLDFAGLGFVFGASDWMSMTRDYDASGFLPERLSGARRLAGGSPFRRRVRNIEEGVIAARWPYRVRAMSQADAELLDFLWDAQQGGGRGADNPLAANDNQLGGHSWPLLILPGRDGLKQAFYGSMNLERSGIVPHTSGGWIPDPPIYDADIVFEEEVYP
jgi:hypothetical protein